MSDTHLDFIPWTDEQVELFEQEHVELFDKFAAANSEHIENHGFIKFLNRVVLPVALAVFWLALLLLYLIDSSEIKGIIILLIGFVTLVTCLWFLKLLSKGRRRPNILARSPMVRNRLKRGVLANAQKAGRKIENHNNSFGIGPNRLSKDSFKTEVSTRHFTGFIFQMKLMVIFPRPLVLVIPSEGADRFRQYFRDNGVSVSAASNNS